MGTDFGHCSAGGTGVVFHSRAGYAADMSVRILSMTLGSLLLALLLAEGAVRFFNLASAERVDQTAYRQVLGDLRPHQNLVSKEIPALAYGVRVNSQGFRGPELQPPAPAKERVLFLGDSITFGQYVEDTATLPAQTGVFLQKLDPERSFEIINAGRCGYTINDELGYFNDKGFRLGAHWVVLTYTVGDIVERAWNLEARRDSLRRGDFRTHPSLLLPVEAFFRRSALIYFLQEARWVWTLNHGKLPGANPRVTFNADYESPPSADYQEALYQYLSEVLALQERVERLGGRLLVVMFPSHALLRPGQSSPANAILKEKFSQLKIANIDVLETLKSHGTEQSLFYVPVNKHPRPLAYRFAAEEIAKFLLKMPRVDQALLTLAR